MPGITLSGDPDRPNIRIGKIITFFLIILEIKALWFSLSAFFKIKTLWLAVLLASPPIAAWALRGGEEKTAAPVMAPPPTEKVVVEVLVADGKSEWRMVDVPLEAVPEPTSALLMMLSTLLLLRRNRCK